MSTQSEDQKKKWNVAGLAIPAGLFIGMGFGFMSGNFTAGLFLGLGGGFLMMLAIVFVLRLKSG